MASVVITGTSKGIGLEAALAFGRAGHKVHATMRNPTQSPALAETAAREKLPIAVSTMDVDSDESVTRAIAAIQKDHGPIDVLVNNAGVERAGSVEELSLTDFRAVMETNYFGAIRCIQAWCRICDNAGAGASSMCRRWPGELPARRSPPTWLRSGLWKR